MNTKAIAFLLCLILTLPTVSMAGKPSGDRKYIRQIRKERKENDRDFKEAENSPLEAGAKNGFRGLRYFAADPDWRINARLVKADKPDTIRMKTTTERLPLYLVYGKAIFQVNGKDYTLTVYRNVGLMTKPGFEDYLFIPFTDLTSGKGSYGGGRYVDSRIQDDGTILIDFNKAYNPYCVYNKKYSCPIPPAENDLDLKVTAGVKDYRH